MRQADLDRWLVDHRPHQRQLLKPFLAWATRAGHMPRLRVPPHRPGQQTPITQHRRLALLRKLITDDAGGLRARVAAILVLLYAQPLGRILRLTIDDIDTTGPDVQLHLGNRRHRSPTPSPSYCWPCATSAPTCAPPQRDARWLFPGRRAGQPLTVDTIAALIRDLGVPTVPGRLAALRQLVLQAPAPVVAQALGFHHDTTQRHHAAVGGTWNRYSPL